MFTILPGFGISTTEFRSLQALSQALGRRQSRRSDARKGAILPLGTDRLLELKAARGWSLAQPDSACGFPLACMNSGSVDNEPRNETMIGGPKSVVVDH